ncbi:MAG: hypothetical protein IJL92_02700 [Thermoguttaceae bacterium]|nr:hypothetical protein [Thermoguttaceae bacterium]
MAYQLVYTSSPKGLKPGAFGFCVVACTRGMKEQTAAALEALSGYRRVYSDPQSALRNPVSCSHILFDTPTGRLRVLARVADAGLDYSGRTNMIASFFEVAANELVAPGPAALFSQPGLFVERWTPADAPRYFETPAALPNVVMIPRGCDEWRRATGSAAWAGVLASTVATRRPVTLVVRPDQNVLRLFQEAIALLPPSERWNATFSTYYMKTPPGVVCQWKAAMQGSPEELALRSAPGALTINLANPSLLPSPDSLATTPQARRLVAEATGVPMPSATTRVSVGTTHGAASARRSDVSPLVTEIPEPLGGGYSLQPNEVAVPKGAATRKKLNYGRDAVLKVDVPKTRRASGKSLTTKLLIYALVFCLLLVSSVLVLWFAGPLRDVVKGIETRNEAVNEVNGTAGEQTETPKPADSNASDKEQAPANNNNSDQNTSKTSKPAQNNGGNGAAGKPTETPKPADSNASDNARAPSGEESTEPSVATDDTSQPSEEQREQEEKELAEEFNNFIENEYPDGKSSFADDLRNHFEQKFQKYANGAETPELKNAIACYDFWQAFVFNNDVIWSPAEINGDEKSGLYITGEGLYSAFEDFFSKRKGQKKLTVRFEEGPDTEVGLVFSVGADYFAHPDEPFGADKTKFSVDRNKRKVGLWFKTRNELLQYAKKQMVLEASKDDDEDSDSNNKSLSLPLSHFKVSGDSEGKLDLKWLSGGDGDSLPEIQNETPKQDTLYCDVVNDGTYSFGKGSKEACQHALSDLTEEQKNEPEKIIILESDPTKGKEQYCVVFSFEWEDSNLVGNNLKIYKSGGSLGTGKGWQPVNKLPKCKELRFDVRLRTEDDDTNPLTVGRIKVPLRAEKEHEDNNVER